MALGFQLVSHYRILSKLASGGMGDVYEAEDLNLGRHVALKFLPEQMSCEPTAVERFRREARASSALNHPNICTIYETGTEGGQCFLAMELLHGETLKQTIKGKPLNVPLLLDLAVEISEALEAAHSAGVIHRDIKSTNIFVNTGGHVKVLDFGLAKVPTAAAAAEQTTVLTSAGSIIGTFNYMSPEQVRGEDLDARTDLFSFGVVLYEMATGRLPFGGITSGAVAHSILADTPTPPVRLNPEISPKLEEIITRALEKDRKLRYQSASDLRADLQRVQRDFSIGRGSSSFAGKHSGPRPRVRNLLALAASGALFAVLAILMWLHVFRRDAADSVAILPFVNASANPDAEYLSDGLTEGVINNLSQVRGLRVTARSSVFRYKGKDTDPQKIGHDLHVRTVLSGRLLQRGNTVIVQAELMDISNGSQLWGGQYQRNMADIFALQEDLSREISEKLRLRLSGDEKERLTKRYTENSEAYQHYLRGRYFLNRWSPADSQQAIHYFQEAIASDPGYALAYAGLADTYISQTWFGQIRPNEGAPKAKAAALKALAVDEKLPEAHVSLAFVSFLYDWDWQGAGKHFERALELNPSYVNAHAWYSYYLAASGRSDAALGEAKRALDLDPASPGMNQNFGLQLIYARRYDEAIEQSQRTLEMGYHDAHSALGSAYEAKGMYREALFEYEKYAEVDRESPRSIASLGYVHARLNERNEALKALRELRILSKERYVPAGYFAAIYTGLGDKDQAFAWLDKAYDEHSFGIALLGVLPVFEPLHSDPRYADLLRRVGLSPLSMK